MISRWFITQPTTQRSFNKFQFPSTLPFHKFKNIISFKWNKSEEAERRETRKNIVVFDTDDSLSHDSRNLNYGSKLLALKNLSWLRRFPDQFISDYTLECKAMQLFLACLFSVWFFSARLCLRLCSCWLRIHKQPKIFLMTGGKVCKWCDGKFVGK